MPLMFKLLIILIGCILIFNLTNCNHFQKEIYKDRADFFENKKFNGSYSSTLPLHSPDSTVARIKKEVPKQWQVWACENAYYSIPEEHPDTFFFNYLDKCDVAFKNDSMRVLTQVLRGRLYLQRVQYDSSEICLHEAHDLSLKRKDFARVCDAQYIFGDLYSNRGDYPEAIRHLNNAYEIARTLGSLDEGRTYIIMRFIGGVYVRINDYRKALYWDKLTWEYCKTTNEHTHKSLTSSSIAYDYLKLGLLDSAQMWIDTNLYTRKLYNIDYRYGATRVVSAEIKTMQGNHKAALEDLSIAKTDTAFLHYIGFVAKLYNCAGLIYYNTQQLDSSAVYYTKSLQNPDTLQQSETYFQLAKIYEKKGNATQALSHERKGHELRNSILSASKERIFARFEADARIKEIEYNVKTEQLRWIISTLLLVTALSVSLFFIVQYRQKQRLLAQEKELIEAREQLKAKALSEAEVKIEAQGEALKITEEQIGFKNTLIQELEMKLFERNQTDIAKELESNNMIPLRSVRILTNNDWVHFRELFDVHFPNFSISLKQQFPNLTVSETRLFLLIKAGFEAHEIANVLGISTASVYTARYRLRRKLGLGEEPDLERFVNSI